MDNIVLHLLRRLNQHLKQEAAFEADTHRFFDDPQYADQVLGLSEEIGRAGSEEISVLSKQLRARHLHMFVRNSLNALVLRSQTFA